MNKFEQIHTKLISSNSVKLYLNLPHFRSPKVIGELFRKEKTLRTIKRNFQNLFHLFNGPGLGINTEVLSRFNFEFIEIPYNNEVLRTTREHFLHNSIPSPFVSDKVDPQRILKISDFIIPETGQFKEQTFFDKLEVQNG